MFVRPRSVLAATAGIAIALVACTAPGASSPAAAQVDAELVGVGSALAQMRGHLRVAADLSAAGDTAGASVHTGHPAAELLGLVRPELEEAGADADAVAEALQAASDAIGTDEAATAIEAAIEATNTAEAAAAGDLADDDGYIGSVIASVLATASHEYEEAVVDGELQELIEYQDAYGFTLESHERYAQIAEAVAAASEEEAAEIDEAFELLAEALPATEPPATLADPEAVALAAMTIGHELEETVGALPVTEADPAAVEEEINGLLDEIADLVEQGNRDEAAELAAQAYLENYEIIEAAVIAAAPDVNEELEPLLGAALRAAILENADAGEIATMIDRARELLAEAVHAVEAAEGH